MGGVASRHKSKQSQPSRCWNHQVFQSFAADFCSLSLNHKSHQIQLGSSIARASFAPTIAIANSWNCESYTFRARATELFEIVLRGGGHRWLWWGAPPTTLSWSDDVVLYIFVFIYMLFDVRISGGVCRKTISEQIVWNMVVWLGSFSFCERGCVAAKYEKIQLNWNTRRFSGWKWLN